LNKDLAHSAESVLNHPTIQKAAATVTIGSGVTLALDLIPLIMGGTTAIMGFIASWYIIRKNRTESEKLDLEISILKQKQNDNGSIVS
jgi:formate hydrogenlyase subunit 3/multisubunit Na+/H+ antiporter MnhD subunit